MADDRIVSLDLGSQQVSGAVFSKLPGGGLRLDQFERVDLIGDPSDESGRQSQMGLAVKELVGKLKLKGKKLKYVTSSHPVLLKFASLPALDGERVDQIVEFEAQQQVPYPINEVAWGYQLVGEEDDIEVDVILAAVKSEELDEIDEVVTDAGIKSEGAEISPVALFNALRYNYSDLEETVLLIDIGARTTDLIFMEGGRTFIRTIKIGGADVTRAIAKEFGTEFGEADQRKVADGFVALGGPYADHEDPVIAGMSKVIRNSLTRLHSEIMRTTNFYRSQQGGSAPTVALLSGATSSLPFIREFFAEKLNIPIDYFNGLRNVTLGSGIDHEYVGSHAHNLGELVGSAAGNLSVPPVLIELVPESVQKDRELDRRKPALIITTFVIAALLAALGFFFKKGSEVADEQVSRIEGKANKLKKLDGEISDLKSEILRIDGQKKPFVEAVRHRAYWVLVFEYLSNKMQNDLMFLTVLEPLSDGRPVVDSAIVTGGSIAGAATAAPAASGELKIDSFAIEGLWRENVVGGATVVYKYFEDLKRDAENDPASALFDLGEVNINEAATVDGGAGGTHYAYPWKMVLPLPERNQVKFSK